MSAVRIHHKVDLVIQLIDTTTGALVESYAVKLTNNGRAFKAIRRGNGIFVVLNVGREDFTLGIDTEGYEPCRIDIVYENLDERLPVQTVFLIPKENAGGREGILSLSGHLDGIESLEGVCVSRQICAFSEYDSRKNIMTVFKPSGILKMEDIFYGIINNDESYERIEVVEKIGDCQVRLKDPLQEEFSLNSPISRVVFGQISDGDFCFRVRDNSSDLRYLLSYLVKGKKRFRLIDFHQSEEIRLD